MSFHFGVSKMKVLKFKDRSFDFFFFGVFLGGGGGVSICLDGAAMCQLN